MLNLQQRQSLQQKLSPQQIQYIKLLQLPTLALEQRIKAELEMNPLLEEGEEEEELEVVEEEGAETEAEASSEETELEGSEEQERSDVEEDDYDWEDYLNSSEDLYGYKAQVDSSDDDEDRELPMPARVSMAEHLRNQLPYLDLSDSDELIAEQIIGSIDEDGYLRRTSESIIDDLVFNYGIMAEDEDVERVIRLVQTLEPVGIASRTLQECLLVQLHAMPPDTPARDVAVRMLEKAYKDFTMKHFEAIKRRLNLTDAQLKDAFDVIQRLNPKPGEGEFTAAQNYITPDFTVRFLDDEFLISLNSANAPQLRISKGYQHMLEKLSSEKRRGVRKSEIDSETKNFLKVKLESARWFINSINQRRATMLKVMHTIVELQQDFFKFGEGNLKPMILKDIAERIEMDISTVSRVVNGKYVQSEFGVYELKYFFSEGLSTDSGEEVSNKEVKAIIEGIIAEENKQKPLSDQKIANMLEKEGFNIARRTVTKYREQLGVPVARLRKEIVLS
jgi:RNA polymerase sigma-54 factor